MKNLKEFVETELGKVLVKINRGQGEYGTPSYVQEKNWYSCQGEALALSRVLRKIDETIFQKS